MTCDTEYFGGIEINIDLASTLLSGSPYTAPISCPPKGRPQLFIQRFTSTLRNEYHMIFVFLFTMTQAFALIYFDSPLPFAWQLTIQSLADGVQ
jgi:hypothetical protein